MKKSVFGVLCALCISAASFSQGAAAVEPQNQKTESQQSHFEPLPPVIVNSEDQTTEDRTLNTTMETAIELENRK